MRKLLLIIGILSLFNVAFMYNVANPTIGFTLQAAISVFIILYGIFLKKIPKIVHIITGALFLIPIAFSLFLAIYGNTKNVDYTEDAVIVLGAGINEETVSKPLSRRLNEAVLYWEQNKDAYIVVCGGLGNRAVITEAEAMSRYLTARGVPIQNILLEESSTSTFENLAFAKEILDEHFPDGYRALLITNDFHVYRTVHTARLLGISAGHIGAPTDWYTIPVNYLREMTAVVYRLFYPDITSLESGLS